MKRVEKIEVRKTSGVYFYTGEISEYDDDNIIIKTIKGETIIFRKDQIEGRQIIEMKGNDKNGEND